MHCIIFRHFYSRTLNNWWYKAHLIILTKLSLFFGLNYFRISFSCFYFDNPYNITDYKTFEKQTFFLNPAHFYHLAVITVLWFFKTFFLFQWLWLFFVKKPQALCLHNFVSWFFPPILIQNEHFFLSLRIYLLHVDVCIIPLTIPNC